jgi:hypothetical protein
MSLQNPDLSNNRFEIKYLVPARDVQQIKSALANLMVEDPHTGTINNGYYNHSIYFDNDGLDLYREKHEGQNLRVKVRMRGHKDAIDCAPGRLFLELKHRQGAIGTKERYILDPDEARDILSSNIIPVFKLGDETVNNVPETLHYLRRRDNFRPVVSILYHRAAYHVPAYPGVRITFDTGVQASSITSFDAPMTSFRPCLDPRDCVIELKYNQTAPRLLLKRLNELGLRQVTLSKYAVGLQTIYRNIVSVA